LTKKNKVSKNSVGGAGEKINWAEKLAEQEESEDDVGSIPWCEWAEWIGREGGEKCSRGRRGEFSGRIGLPRQQVKITEKLK